MSKDDRGLSIRQIKSTLDYATSQSELFDYALPQSAEHPLPVVALSIKLLIIFLKFALAGVYERTLLKRFLEFNNFYHAKDNDGFFSFPWAAVNTPTGIMPFWQNKLYYSF